MTNPAFVMRTAEAQEHFLYTSLNELDQLMRSRAAEASSSVSCAWQPTRVINMDKLA